MGGFTICNTDSKPTKTVSLGHFRRLLNNKVIDFPHLTCLEIQERSNFHPAFALTALLQAIWFIIQCLSRLVRRDPVITQLEAISATIDLVAWCIFFFAWKKPLDAQSPILLKPTLNPLTLRNRDDIRVRVITVRDAFDSEQNLSGSQSAQRRFQLECPQSRSTSISKIIGLRPTSWSLLSIPFWPIKSVYRDMFRLIPPESYGAPDFPDGTLKIPLFHVQNTMFQRIFLLPVAVLSFGISIVSLLFVIQQSRTVTHFSSPGVQLAWRVASIASTSFSAFILGLVILSNCFYFLTSLFGPGNWICRDILRGFSDVCLALVFCTLLIGLVPFLLARVVLLVASVVFLWSDSLPEKALVGWSWVDYIPHVS